MKLWDVKAWVYAFRPDSPYHARSRDILLTSLEKRETFLFNSGVASSFLRIVTNPKIFRNPSSDSEAWDFIDYIEASASARHVPFDEMAFGIFKHLCLSHGITGNGVPDAYLAALAIRHDAEFVTYDKSIAEFRGLRTLVLDGTKPD